MNLDLSQRRALVCGASKGIGRATAIELAELGCEIIALARDEKNLSKLIAELPKNHSQEHSYIAIDLSDFAKLKEQVLHKVNQKTIEILINNTGGPAPGPIEEATDEQFDQAFKLHLRANALLASCMLPGMREKKFGRIINIISTSVKSPIEDLGVSNTVRAAVAAWGKTLSYEVAKDGITVNSVLPGSIETERLLSLNERKAHQRKVDAKIIHQEMVSQIPAGRIGHPREIAQVIAFLASPSASYINGVALAVDGGRTRTL